jgi:fructose-1,6-bisphosphatase
VLNDLIPFLIDPRVIHSNDATHCWFDRKNDSAFAAGDFLAVFDPLDGSKNIDSSLPVGTIFGIYRRPPVDSVSVASFLQDGRSLVAAGYCLYS